MRLPRSARSRHRQHAFHRFRSRRPHRRTGPGRASANLSGGPGGSSTIPHGPDEIWRRTQDVIRQAMAQQILQPKDLAAIGITNQRETAILWNKQTGRGVSNAIVWQNSRVENMVAEFAKSGGPDRFRQNRASPLDPFSVPSRFAGFLRIFATCSSKPKQANFFAARSTRICSGV